MPFVRDIIIVSLKAIDMQVYFHSKDVKDGFKDVIVFNLKIFYKQHF